jgi:hypothetical protein
MRRTWRPTRSSSLLSCSLIVVLMSGCVIRGDARGLAYGVDGALVLTGAVIMADASRTECSGWGASLCETGKSGERGLGAVMVAGGLAAMLLTAMVNAGEAPGTVGDHDLGMELDVTVNVDVGVDAEGEVDVEVHVDVDMLADETRAIRPRPSPPSRSLERVRPECRPHFEAIRAATTRWEARAAVQATPSACFRW